MKVANRTFLISGGSSGLGLATVEELIESQGYVVVMDLRPPPLPWRGPKAADGTFISSSPSALASVPTTASLPIATSPSTSLPTSSSDARTNQRVLYLKTDLSKPEEIEVAVEQAVQWTAETNAPLGGILNCAGLGYPELLIDGKGTAHRTSSWDYMIAVNLSGTFHLSRLGLKHLHKVQPEGEDGERGVILMVASSAAFEGQIGTTAYAASKGALLSMTLPMARDCARWGIRVVTLAPGPFTTPLTDLFSDRVKEQIKAGGLLYPRRYGIPKEFADTVKWVLECAYINGETIRLSGGGRVQSKM